ncbi:MAG: flippase-like domain-containing protein [Actinobacteria bacterium]|nr:flippase-like domain-containing protein [Actinomycetota bacterium]
MSRPVRVFLTLLVTALGTAYLLWKIDVSRTLDVLAGVDPWYFLAAVALMVVTVWPMALRWQWLLRAKGIDDSLGWLTRAYFVSYAAGQILPTSIGGDAVRILETVRRHPGKGGVSAASVLLERALGGAATLVLAAIGFALAVGRYDVGAYLWVELIFVIGTVIAGVLIFSPAAGRLLAKGRPLLAPFKLDRLAGELWSALHSYRQNARLLLGVFALTLAVQAVRVLAIWCSGKAVGIDVSPRVYYVMGPLLFLVMLVPFTINGLAVREAFFVSFLGNVGVAADEAFAAGFLFFLVTIALSMPGAVILLREGVRGKPNPELREST